MIMTSTSEKKIEEVYTSYLCRTNVLKELTWIISYREKQAWNSPADLQLFKKETLTQVFPVEFVKISRTVVVTCNIFSHKKLHRPIN